MRSLRLLAFLSLSTAAITTAIAACSSDDSAPAGGADAATGDGSNGGRDGSATEGDADSPADARADGTKDAGKDANKRDANGPGEAGTECVFNHDCQLALRCSACDAGYCFCEPGARGTGENGVFKCDSGDQCASSVCVEDWCSDECKTNDDCTGMLPRCVAVPGYATLCAPPK